MFAGLPQLPISGADEPLNHENYDKAKERVIVTVLPRVERVTVGYAALCHLLYLSRNAVTRWSVNGRLCGLQLGSTVEVTDVRPNPPRDQRRDPRETDEERRKRLEAERREMRRVMQEADTTFTSEQLDTYQVGQFIVSSATFNAYSEPLLHQLMELYDRSQPMALLSYDPFITGFLGKPCLRAYVPTEEYVSFHNLYKAAAKERRAGNKIIRESGVTHAGVLREVPVDINVDVYQKLGMKSLVLQPVQDVFSAVHGDAVNDYVEALVNSVRGNSDALLSALEQENKINAKDPFSTTPLAQRIKTLLLLHHVREQTQHLEALCNSTLLNTSLLRDL